MVNPLSNEEMRALEAIVERRNFPGLCAGMAAMCARWKTSVAEDAERNVLVVMEAFFEMAANETKLIVMAQRSAPEVCAVFAHHKEYDVILSPGLDPPDVRPQADEPKAGADQ